jgi:hypothetical protein
MSIGSTTYDMQGGTPAFGYGGFGGGGVIEGLLLGTLLRGGFGNNGWGNNGWGGGYGGFGGPFPGTGPVVADQNISDLRKDVQGVNTQVESLGNEIQSAIFNQTLGQTQQFSNLGDLVMNGFSATALAAKDATIQGIINTQAIKDQAANFQVVNQENFCQIRAQIAADGDATRALINTNVIQGLRDELDSERRRSNFREVEINVTQTNNQLQAQMQAQTQAVGNALSALQAQIAHQTNSMINLGTMTGNTQAATAANTKVNS